MLFSNDIVFNTSKYFNPVDAANATGVSRSWNQILSSERMWGEILLNLEGGKYIEPDHPESSNRNNETLSEIAHARCGRHRIRNSGTQNLEDTVTLDFKSKVLKLIGLMHVPVLQADTFYRSRRIVERIAIMADDYRDAFREAKKYLKKNRKHIENALSKDPTSLKDSKDETALRAVTYTYRQARAPLPKYLIEMDRRYNSKPGDSKDSITGDADPGDSKASVSVNRNNPDESNDLGDRKASLPIDRKGTLLVGVKSHGLGLDKIGIVLVIALAVLGIGIKIYPSQS